MKQREDSVAPQSKMRCGTLRRAVTSGFIVLLLLLLVVDTLPPVCGLHQLLKETAEPVLDVLGIWQGPWGLFAPEPDKENTWLTAEITFSNGDRETWETPRWQEMSVGALFLASRHMEYYDNVLRTENEAAWPDFADYLARQLGRSKDPSVRPVRVVFVRNTIVCLPPDEGELPGRNEPWGTFHSETFYVRTYGQ